jgi:hypothetical protein
MKAVPVLAVITALSLGAVVLLYVEQQELKEQLLTSSRVSNARTSSGVGVAPLDAQDIDDQRIEDIVMRTLARMRADETPGPAVPVEAAGAVAEGEGTDAAAADPLDVLLAETEEGNRQDVSEMKEFRTRVRRAMDLNRREDDIKRIFGTLDRLSQEGRIGALNDDQKGKVTRAIISNRQKTRNVWRNVWSSIPNNESMSRQERFQAAREQVRIEYETLRTETTKEMEEIVPAADAKVIIESSMRGGDTGGFRSSRRGR